MLCKCSFLCFCVVLWALQVSFISHSKINLNHLLVMMVIIFLKLFFRGTRLLMMKITVSYLIWYQECWSMSRLKELHWEKLYVILSLIRFLHIRNWVLLGSAATHCPGEVGLRQFDILATRNISHTTFGSDYNNISLWHQLSFHISLNLILYLAVFIDYYFYMFTPFYLIFLFLCMRFKVVLVFFI